MNLIIEIYFINNLNRLSLIINERKKIEISIIASILPIIILIILLAINVGIYGDDSLNGSNQFILLVGAFIAAIIGYFHKVSYKKIINSISKSVKATTSPILILLFVGALGWNLVDKWNYSCYDILWTSNFSPFIFSACMCNYLCNYINFNWQ